MISEEGGGGGVALIRLYNCLLSYINFYIYAQVLSSLLCLLSILLQFWSLSWREEVDEDCTGENRTVLPG